MQGFPSTAEALPVEASRSGLPAGSAAALLLDWYDRNHRVLPWRITPAMATAGRRPDPYHIWLSEVMLQQTTVQAVKAYFEKFLALWPEVTDLAAADTEDVMKAWAGLGYYARARNLKACAEQVASRHGGRFPDTEDGLRALPGIGDYTAAAIAAIAFNRQSAVLDGNVERVVSRLYRVETPVPSARPELRRLVAALTPADRPGDFAQAMMDLGSTICTPRRPVCALCPLQADCHAFKAGDPERFPVKLAKKAKPVRYGTAFVATDATGAVYLSKRGDKGLLGGMTEVPCTDWTTDPAATPTAPFVSEADPARAIAWRDCGGIVHVFTHFELRLAVLHAEVERDAISANGWWEPRATLAAQALPTVMKKAIEKALPGSFSPKSSKKAGSDQARS
ncbi:A/G-specific adenine glycosylase [Rhizobium sp. Leaf384]|uniref:A/G-specific adenine glycosylase n=1 Tax=unclassified Rhizobium TaxID=2613769 RepID=UPI000715E073|nr:MULTISPECIES: A/G-specific adenine glycosylase [unclassified Rhizobium]KQS77405.1 A/G-specific adenine glycosylase [Rhizobium sp. Leaf383]KQS80687.1 A/G-specific adenine glycosylase [Rhizobium sp. Leaf384]